MSNEWQRVESIDGYERTYRFSRYRVAYKPLDSGAIYMHRDLFVDGSDVAVPMPPVFVDHTQTLCDQHYLDSLRTVDWHISTADPLQ